MPDLWLSRIGADTVSFEFAPFDPERACEWPNSKALVTWTRTWLAANPEDCPMRDQVLDARRTGMPANGVDAPFVQPTCSYSLIVGDPHTADRIPGPDLTMREAVARIGDSYGTTYIVIGCPTNEYEIDIVRQVRASRCPVGSDDADRVLKWADVLEHSRATSEIAR